MKKEKKKEKSFQVFVGYDLYFNAEPLLIKFLEVTVYVKDRDWDKYFIIIHILTFKSRSKKQNVE